MSGWLLLRVFAPGRAVRLILAAAPCIAMLLLGALWSNYHLQSGLQQMRQCAARLSGQPVIGTFVSLPVRRDSSWQAIFADTAGRRIQVRGSGATLPAPGSSWQLHLSSTVAPSVRRAWLLRSNLCGTARLQGVLSHPLTDRPASVALSLRTGLVSLRGELSRKVVDLAGHSQATAVLRAVTLGDSSGLDTADWDSFRRTGTVHLMVVSGLHLGLVALLGSLLIAAIVRRIGPALLWMPLPIWRWAGALTSALCYAMLAGMGVSVQRALTMLAVGAFFALKHRHAASVPISLLQALGLVLLLDPLAALAPGLWLSFTGVAVLLAYGASQPLSVDGNRSFARIKTNLRQFLGAQLAITLAMVPALALASITPSIWSLPANLLAVPLLGLVAVPMGLVGVGSLQISDTVAGLVLKLAAWAATPALEWINWLAALLASALLLSPAGTPCRGLWPLLLVCVLAAGPVDKGVELHLHAAGRSFAGQITLASRRLHLYSDWRGLQLSSDSGIESGCPVLHWQRGEVSLYSLPAGPGHCALGIRAPNRAWLLSGPLSAQADSALLRQLRSTPRRHYDTLIGSAVWPHSYGLIALLAPADAWLIGEGVSAGQRRYGWFNVRLQRFALQGVHCRLAREINPPCRPTRKAWWEKAPIGVVAGF